MHSILLAPFLAFLLSLPQLAQAPAIPQPNGPLAVAGGADAATLFEVATAYAERLGLPLAASADALPVLMITRVGLLSDVHATAAEVHQVAQSLLVLGGFVVTGFDGGLGVVRWDELPRDGTEALPGLAFDEADLADLQGQEALLVRVSATIPGVDARQMTMALRTLGLQDAPAVVCAAADAETLVLSGPAASVRQMLAVLRGSADPAAGIPVADDPALRFPRPAAGAAPFALGPDDTLLAMLERCSAVTGRMLWADAPLRARLAGEPCGLLRPTECAAERADVLVESVLANARIGISVCGRGPRAIHALVGDSRTAERRPLLVDLEDGDLALVRDHPATLFGGVVRLERLEVRQLTTSLRTILTDTVTQSALAFADHALYVHGPGASAAQLADVFAVLEGRTPKGATASQLVGAPMDAGERLLDVTSESSYLDLVEAWSEATGRAVLASASQREDLRKRSLGAAAARLASAELDTAVETELCDLGYGIAVYASDPPVLAVNGLSAAGFGMHRFVAADDLDALAAHPALLVTTGLLLERLEVRSAVMRARRQLTSAVLEHGIAASDHQVVLGGTVRSVRERAATMRAWNAAGGLPEDPEKR